MAQPTRGRLAEAGLILLELLFVISIVLVLLATAVPALLTGLDDFRTRAAPSSNRGAVAFLEDNSPQP
ncbi:MAG: hypothetical protein HYU53_13375 [Acidobacteria bacterium]|nr:hypothetical protein [Acidobacteriota bacterium]